MIYDFTELLGKGSFGEVRKAVHKSTGGIFAVKILKKVIKKKKNYYFKIEYDEA